MDVLDSSGHETVQRPVFKDFDIPELKEAEVPGPRTPVLLKEPGAKKPEKVPEQNSRPAQTGESGRDSVADSGLGSVRPDVRA